MLCLCAPPFSCGLLRSRKAPHLENCILMRPSRTLKYEVLPVHHQAAHATFYFLLLIRQLHRILDQSIGEKALREHKKQQEDKDQLIYHLRRLLVKARSQIGNEPQSLKAKWEQEEVCDEIDKMLEGLR